MYHIETPTEELNPTGQDCSPDEAPSKLCNVAYWTIGLKRQAIPINVHVLQAFIGLGEPFGLGADNRYTITRMAKRGRLEPCAPVVRYW
jgi:hypothetical protein